MQQMKPCKAWGLIDADGKVILGTVTRLRERAIGMRDEPWEKAARVRILEDAAVERAVELFHSLVAGRPKWKDAMIAAIRDLGGRP